MKAVIINDRTKEYCKGDLHCSIIYTDNIDKAQTFESKFAAQNKCGFLNRFLQDSFSILELK